MGGGPGYQGNGDCGGCLPSSAGLKLFDSPGEEETIATVANQHGKGMVHSQSIDKDMKRPGH